MGRVCPALLLPLLLIATGAGRPRQTNRRLGQRRYESGLQLYAAGDKTRALAAFLDAARLDPRNEAFAAAVARMQRDLAADAARRGAPRTTEPPDDGDSTVLLDLARCVSFDEVLGDALEGAGAFEAARGRVAQLLAERRLALARQRPFGKERELRALVRRLPTLAA